jgi:hypothetical protein
VRRLREAGALVTRIGQSGKIRLASERQILFDAIFVRGMDSGATTQVAAAFGIFGLHQMPAARAQSQNLATGSDFKPLGCRLLRFNAFWTSHNVASALFEKSAQYRVLTRGRQELF